MSTTTPAITTRGRQLRKILKLTEHDYIITAYAQPASGPGWANAPLWVIIANPATGSIREQCIQPEDQTAEMQQLYAFSALAHDRMTSAVKVAVGL